MGKPSVFDDPPNDSTAGKGRLHAMLPTDPPAAVPLGANKHATTGNVARSSSSSRASQMSAALFGQNFVRPNQSSSGHPRRKHDLPPCHRPPGDAVLSVLSYKCVRMDGRLSSGEIRIRRRPRSIKKERETSPSFFSVIWTPTPQGSFSLCFPGWPLPGGGPSREQVLDA